MYIYTATHYKEALHIDDIKQEDYYFHASYDSDLVWKEGYNDVFGDFMFFTGGYPSRHYGEYLYAIHDSYLKQPITPYEIVYKEDDTKLKNLIEDMMSFFDTDQDTAWEILAEEVHLSGEEGWEQQRFIGEAAQLLGYDVVEVNDEYGTSYMIDMKKHKNHIVFIIEDTH